MFEMMPHKKWGFIDKTGHMVIEPRFDDVLRDQYGGCMPYSHKVFKNFSEGLCAVRVENKWGYIDKTGNMVVPAQYDNAGTFSEGLACVRLGTKYGYIDKTGKIIIPVQLDFPAHAANARNDNPDWDFSQGLLDKYEYCEGLAVAEKDGLFGYIDKQGKFVIEPNYSTAYPFYEGTARVEQRREPGTMPKLVYIDKSGQPVVAADKNCIDYTDGIFLAQNGLYDKSRRLYFLRKDGTRLSNDEYEDARVFSEGLAAVAPHFAGNYPDNAAYGYIDMTGKIVIKPQYDISGNNIAGNFRSGRAIVSQTKNGPMGNYEHLDGIINKKGMWILQPKYSHIATYCDGYARAFSDHGCVYLDMNGQEIVQAGSGWGNSFSEDLAAVMEK